FTFACNAYPHHLYLHSFPTRRSSDLIDPLLLRRQKELAEKSQELQELETSAIEIVEDDEDQEHQQAAEPETAVASDAAVPTGDRSEEHTSELQSRFESRMPSSA